jgi:hypothetical protein
MDGKLHEKGPRRPLIYVIVPFTAPRKDITSHNFAKELTEPTFSNPPYTRGHNPKE